MQTQTIEDIKALLEAYRNSLILEFSDPEQHIHLKINGHFKIIDLKIADDLTSDAIEKIVPDLVGKAIETVGHHIRMKLESMQTVPQ